MNNEKKISLTFDLEQVTNDVLVKCNQISQSIRDDAMEDIKANVLEPDNPESRSIINRAVTEAFGEVKVLCQRYLKSGRTIDDNDLERIVKKITFVQVEDKDAKGRTLYDCTVGGTATIVYAEDASGVITWKDAETNQAVTPDAAPEVRMVETDEVDTMEFEKIKLDLYISNFNVAVTDHLKSSIHKYVVDYIMSRFLQDQLADKAAEYKGLADGEDSAMIVRDLNARDRFNFRKPAWV